MSGTPRSFQVAGVGTIPDDAIAVTANVTVTGQTASGYVSLTPSRDRQPDQLDAQLPDRRHPRQQRHGHRSTRPASSPRSTSRRRDRTTQLLVDVTGYFVADDGGATYEPVAPVRLLDTRFGNGLSGALPRRTRPQIRPDHRSRRHPGRRPMAITGNLTVTGQTRGGYVSVTPTPTATPTTSTINFPTGDTRANGLTVPLSADRPGGRRVQGAPAGSTHLILDVTGYYLDGHERPALLPARAGAHPRHAGHDADAADRQVHVRHRPGPCATGGHFGVPDRRPGGDRQPDRDRAEPGGYVSVTRTKTTTPTVSTINFPVGDTRANGITVPLDGNDDIHLVYKSSSGATTHLILDLTGYFR